MDTNNDSAPDAMICIRCGETNSLVDSRCIECGAPLGVFASSSPWEMGSAIGSSYASPLSPRTKPMILWGVWLYFGPSAAGAIWLIAFLWYPVFKSEIYPENIGPAIAWSLLAAIYGWLSIWALWSVSLRYFQRE